MTFLIFLYNDETLEESTITLEILQKEDFCCPVQMLTNRNTDTVVFH